MKKSTLLYLIKQQQTEVDVKRKDLIKKELLHKTLTEKLNDSISKVEIEKRLTIDYGNTYGFIEFLKIEKSKQHEINVQIKKVVATIDSMHKQLMEIVMEKNRFEYLLKKLVIKEKALEKKEENSIIDDFTNLTKNHNILN